MVAEFGYNSVINIYTILCNYSGHQQGVGLVDTFSWRPRTETSFTSSWRYVLMTEGSPDILCTFDAMSRSPYLLLKYSTLKNFCGWICFCFKKNLDLALELIPIEYVSIRIQGTIGCNPDRGSTVEMYIIRMLDIC